MSPKHTSKDTDWATVVLAGLGVAALFMLISAIVKDVKKNTSSDVVSDEGKEILGDAEKRKKLQAAVDHYKKEGNWDLLHEVDK